MNAIDVYEFRKRSRKRKGVPVCEVIICTTHSGKVRRKQFPSWKEGREFAEKWQAKNQNKNIYNVSIQAV